MIGLYAKALAALLGGVATWGVTAADHGITASEWFGLLAVLATVAGVFAIPNAAVALPSEEGAVQNSLAVQIMLGLVGAVLLLLLLAAVF